MFDTMEEIYENEFLRALVRDCRRYDMPGVFIEHNLNIQSKDSGIYFVTGIDRAAVRNSLHDKSFNPVDKIIEQEINFRNYHPLKVFKVTNENPAAISYEVQKYCCHSEFVDNVFPLFHINNIDKIPNYTVEYLSKLYGKTHDKNYNDFMRFQYKSMFRKRMINLQKVQNKSGFAGRYRDYEFSKIFNDEEGRIMNFIKYFFRHRQKTSLKFIQREYGTVETLFVEKRQYKQFKKELKKHPDIIYSIDKRLAYKEFSHEDIRNSIYGIDDIKKKTKKCPCIRLAYPREMSPIILGIQHELNYTPHASYTAEEIVNSGKEWDALVISVHDMVYYERNFHEHNIPYAIDTGYANHHAHGEIPIVFFKEDREYIDKICREAIHSGSIIHTVENQKSINDASISKLYYDYDLPKKPTEIKEEKKQANKKVIITNDFDYIK